MRKPISSSLWLAALFVAMACGPSERELTAIAERDSLFAEVMSRAALINEINLELAAVGDTATGLQLQTEAGLARAAEENEVTLARLRNVIQRLEEQETQLAESRSRIGALTSRQSRLLATIEEYQQTVTDIRETAQQREAEFAAVIEQQRSMITALSRQLNTAHVENRALAASNTELAVTVDELTTYANTAYYVIGTKNELKSRGIVTEEGTKFLIFGSKTLQPSRDLNPDDFTAIDLTAVTEIPMPRTDKSYKILTRQNPEFLDESDRGRVRTVMQIESPQDFWAASRFLILVQN